MHWRSRSIIRVLHPSLAILFTLEISERNQVEIVEASLGRLGAPTTEIFVELGSESIESLNLNVA